jgi:adenylylsulfate kinase
MIMEANRRKGLTVWFTGLSSAGKTTISHSLYQTLRTRGRQVEWLDGDAVRSRLSKGLGFSKPDRDENIRRIGFLAELLTRNGVIVLVSAISPYRAVRDEMRRRIGSFLEVYVHAPLEVCERRDVKGIYRRARAGQIHNVTGLDDPYEPPLAHEVLCPTDCETPSESAARVLAAVDAWLDHATDPSRAELPVFDARCRGEHGERRPEKTEAQGRATVVSDNQLSVPRLPVSAGKR